MTMRTCDTCVLCSVCWDEEREDNEFCAGYVSVDETITGGKDKNEKC